MSINDLILVRVSLDYPARLRPVATNDQPFWSGSEDDRTFFAQRMGSGYQLVVPTSDDRSAGMVPFHTWGEVAQMRGSFRVWTVHDSYVDEFEPELGDEPVAEDRITFRSSTGSEVTVWLTTCRTVLATDHVATDHVATIVTWSSGEEGVWFPEKGSANLVSVEVPDDFPTKHLGAQWMSARTIINRFGRHLTLEQQQRITENEERQAAIRDKPSTDSTDPESVGPKAPALRDSDGDVWWLVGNGYRHLPGSPARSLEYVVTNYGPITELNGDGVTPRAEIAVTAAHRADVELIAAELAYEAERRDWCEEYTAFLERVSKKMTFPLKPEPVSKPFEVVLDIPVRITVTVDAETREEAIRVAADQVISIRDLSDLSEDGNYEKVERGAPVLWTAAEAEKASE